MPSKLETFLKDKKIDTRQLVATSQRLEALRPEDRKIRLAKRIGAKAEGDDKKTKETRKPRSGRPINAVSLAKVFAGKPVSGPAKTRILRAVNAVLETKKQEKVDLAAIFDLSIAAPKKKKKVEAKKK
jgi:hypothetical protein